jgi:hypothetical protein
MKTIKKDSTMKPCIASLFFFFLSGVPVVCSAQVTIGSAQSPQKAAILDLRTSDVIGADNVSANKGLLLPRVSLVSPGSLEPFIATATADEKREHTGLKVYNMNDAPPLSKGVYVWNGANWDLYRLPVVSAPVWSGSNGISNPSAALRLGGTLTRATAINQAGYAFRFSQTAGAFSVNTNALVVSGARTGVGVSPSSAAKLAVGGNMLVADKLTATGSVSSLKETVITGNLTIKNPASDTDPNARYILKNTDAAGTAAWAPFSDIPNYSATVSKLREATVTAGLTLTLSEWNTVGASGERDMPGFELALPPGRWLVCLSVVVEPLQAVATAQSPIWGRFRFNYYNGGSYTEPPNYSASPASAVSYIGALNVADRIYPNVKENVIKGYLILNVTGATRTLRLHAGGRSTATGYKAWSGVTSVRIGNPDNPQNYAVAIPM